MMQTKNAAHLFASDVCEMLINTNDINHPRRTMNTIKPVNFDGVILKYVDNEVIMSGNIIHKNPEKYMKDFFDQVHFAVLGQNRSSVNVNIVDLKFLNSSGIKVIVDWIIKVSNLPPHEKYTISFICSPRSFWQETCISTLSIIDPEIVKSVKAL